MTIAPITMDQIPVLGWFSRKPTPPAPAGPDPALAELQRSFETFRASQEQQIAALQAAHEQQIAALQATFAEQLRVEREERRRTEESNTQLGKDLAIQTGYNDMLKENLTTVNQIAQTLSSDVKTVQTLYTQADERLKWQNKTIENMKLEIKELQDQLSIKGEEITRLVQRNTFLELHGELLTEENAEIRAAARGAGVDLREIELRIQDRRNQAAQRKRDLSTVTEPGPVPPGQSPA